MYILSNIDKIDSKPKKELYGRQDVYETLSVAVSLLALDLSLQYLVQNEV